MAAFDVSTEAEELWSRRGERVLPLADFIRDAYETAPADDEVLTGVRLCPWPAGTATAYVKFGIQKLTTSSAAWKAHPGRTRSGRPDDECGQLPGRALVRDPTLGYALRRGRHPEASAGRIAEIKRLARERGP